MYDQFHWTGASARRNQLTMEYEPVQPFLLIALARRVGCQTFLDIGANVGAYSLFASLVPTVARIVAFEANPDTVRELQANVSLNGLEQRIEVQGKAVSSSPGQITFGVISRFSGANSVVDTSIHDRSRFSQLIDVQSVALDDVFPEALKQPLCIKIDVEGHEAQVIGGAAGLLRLNQAIVQIEKYESASSSQLEALEDLGYFRLTAIGPDVFLANIETLRDSSAIVEAYETATADLIAYNHRMNAVVLKRGGVALQLTGRSGEIARNLAIRFLGKRL